jgi:hypothetical protein
MTVGSFIDQPHDSLHPFFPHLGGGARCDPDRLRALNPGHSFPPRMAGISYGACLLNHSQRGNTYCALLVDGTIIDFCFVEKYW